MRPATRPRADRRAGRLLCIDPKAEAWSDARIDDLAGVLDAGDLLVVNDAGTAPASLLAHSAAGAALEVRLLAQRGRGAWSVVLFGEGDWRSDTVARPAPARVELGDVLDFGEGLSARVDAVSVVSPRLVDLCFDVGDGALWRALFARGRPVQYSYLDREPSLASFQTAYAARPWSVEMPSAGRPLRGGLLLELIGRGVGVCALTHAAGLSSTGDDRIDALLPLPERYDIPARTVASIERTRARGGRVIAVGTTVVRALEGSAATHGRLAAGTGVTDLLLGPGFAPRVVTGLLTGMHDPAESHYRLLRAFVPADLLERSHRHAAATGYLGHEFGDSCLIAPAVIWKNG